MSLRPLIAALPPNFFMTLVDVGSAGGVHKRWRPFQPILSTILFEPREGGAASGEIGRGRSRIYPVALSEGSGEVDFHSTALPNMSSFLQPDASVFGRYCKKVADARVVGTEKVQVECLDALAEAEGFRPNLLKVDTQGSELFVLKGAEQALRSVVLAEIEVSFFRRYVDQPVFAEIEAWMHDRDFLLIELHHLKRYRAANSLGICRPLLGGSERSGRVAYGDAIFVRNTEWILECSRSDEGTTMNKALVALLAYGKADHAAALLDMAGETLPPCHAEAIRAALTSLKRSRIFSPLAALLRRG